MATIQYCNGLIRYVHVFVLDHPHTTGVFTCSKQQQMAKRVMASVQDGGYMGEKEPLLGDSESGSSLPDGEELKEFEVKRKGSG